MIFSCATIEIVQLVFLRGPLTGVLTGVLDARGSTCDLVGNQPTFC